jgi:hypothetical protein
MVKFLPVLLLLCPSAWAVNKCIQDGAVTYQVEPCTGQGAALKLAPQPVATPLEVKRANAVAKGRVMVGMTAQQVRRAWGTPSSVNKSVGSYGVHEQWVYDRGQAGSQYVYVDDGVVTAVQTPSE